MGNESTTTKTASWIQIAIVIGFAFWAFKSCHAHQQKRDDEMRGRGMLEAKGFTGEFPPDAGSDYLMMLENSEYQSEDYTSFFRKLKFYTWARAELRKRGLNESELSKVPEWEIYYLMRSASPGMELDRLAKQYD